MDIISDKYGDLKQAIAGDGGLSHRISDTTRRMRESARQMTQAGQEKIRDTATRMDERVHEKPWAYIGGVAVGALFLGYILGKR